MPRTIYEVTAHDPASHCDQLLRVRAGDHRRAAAAVEDCGYEVLRVTEAVYRRPTGDDVPWIALVSAIGVLGTALAAATM